ncbi:MAG: acyl-CoA dehydrogenase family protein [Litorimonas sp.]
MTFDPQALGRLGITEEQVELMDVAENFCRDKTSISAVRELMSVSAGLDESANRDLTDMGWFGIAIPEEYGGVGLSLAEAVPVAEQIGRRLMMVPFIPTTVAAQAMLFGGTQAQKDTYLPKIVEHGSATVALSESNGSFNLNDIETEAVLGPEGYVLTGAKILVENLAAAKIVVLSAKINGKVRLFILDADLIPSAAMRREILIDETKSAYTLTLDGLVLPKSALMDEGKTAATLQRIDLTANLLASAEQVGGAQSCIDYTVDYLKTRKQFGKLIGSYQALKHTIVDAYVSYEKARSLLYAAAHSFEDQGKGEVATRMAAIGAGRALSFAADRAIQFHGGFGFTYDCDAQLYRRRAIFHDSLFGNTRWHKQKLTALLFN